MDAQFSMTKVKMNSTFDTGSLTGSYLGENYIWAIGMQLAWNDLCENVINAKVKISTDNSAGKTLFEQFNKRKFSRKALSENNYFVKSGFGQETVDQIREKLREKFQARTTDSLSAISLLPSDLICFSYLSKNFRHKVDFKEIEMTFRSTPVKGFTIANDQNSGVKLIDYDDDDNFVIGLASRDELDEIYFIKGNDGASMDEILHFLRDATVSRGYPIHKLDVLQIPNVKIDYHRGYKELIGAELINRKIKPLYIAQMTEQIKLSINYQGAVMENEAMMLLTRGGRPTPKQLILDKPFWLIMKEANKKQPYLILRVENTKVLESI